MVRRVFGAALLALALAVPVWAGDGLTGGRQPPPLFKITPLRDGRYLLEPLHESGVATRPQVNVQPNLNLPEPGTQAGKAASGSPAARHPG